MAAALSNRLSTTGRTCQAQGSQLAVKQGLDLADKFLVLCAANVFDKQAQEQGVEAKVGTTC
jgi:hypothetical protein